MEIKVTRHRGFGMLDTLFDVKISQGGAKINEYCLSHEDVSGMAVRFLEDTLLDNCWKSEFVGKLIEAGIITHEQILEYVEESGDE